MLYTKKINHDMFNISRRIKQIDKGYFVVFNYRSNKWEVHHKDGVRGTYCLTSPYKKLDNRLIDYVYKTSLVHNSNLLKDIEANNQAIELKSKEKEEYIVKSQLEDIYNCVSGSTKSYDLNNSFKTKWL